MATKTSVTTVTAGVAPTVVTEAEKVLDAAAGNTVIVNAIQSAASGISPKARKIIYFIGVGLGIVIAAAATVQAAVTGNVADVAGSVGGLALSVTNLLAAAHLNTAS